VKRHSKHARHARKPTRAEMIAQNMRRRARQRRDEAEAEAAPSPERFRAPVPTPPPAGDTAHPGPVVKPTHRGSGRWACEIDGKPIKDIDSGDVVLFDSKDAAQAAGESFVRALRDEG
jgi:hypothetical protein